MLLALLAALRTRGAATGDAALVARGLSTAAAQLLSGAGFSSGSPRSAPLIAQDEAQRLAAKGGEAAIGSQLMYCTRAASAGTPFDRDCWIVSLPGCWHSGPPGHRVHFAKDRLALIDAETGAFLIGVEG
jgi:hypothetical protein